MTSDERGGPRKGRPDTTTASRVADEADEEQLVLWPSSIPEHRLHPSEADLRKFVNSQPRKRGWAA
jgi:hypothetical protein